MEYWLATIARSLLVRRPEVVCVSTLWEDGVAELRRRTLGGRRESGAFLLGRRSRPSIVERFVYYDDIDRTALDTGIVVIDGRKLGELWKLCRENGQDVIADVHVHPRGYRQSASDKANPVIPEAGHIAIILPDFATGEIRPGGIGIHRYLGNRHWRDESERFFPPFHVGWYAWS